MTNRFNRPLMVVLILLATRFLAGCAADDGGPCASNEALDASGECVCVPGTTRNGEGICVVLSSCEEIVEVIEGGDPLRHPSGGYRTSQNIVLRNISTSTMTIVGATFGMDFIGGGHMQLEAKQSSNTWTPGSDIAYTLTFVPESDDGCDQRAKGEVTFSFVNPDSAGCEFFLLPYVYFGECDDDLICVPNEITFGERIAGFPAHESVTCSNVSDESLTIQQAEIEGRDADVFSVTANADLPVLLAVGDSIEMEITLDSETIGDFEAELVIEPAENDAVTVSLSGTLVRRRPLCSDPRPEFGEPPLSGSGYSISLETDVISSYTGEVRSFWRYSDMSPLVGDFLVTSGAFSDPACDVGQNGHRYYWQGEACVADDGTIHNIHAVPAHAKVAEWMEEIELGEKLTIIGWEVARITYDNGGWWQDDGCNTLIIAWVCED